MLVLAYWRVQVADVHCRVAVISLVIHTGIRVGYWHYGDEKRIWWFVQIAYIIVHVRGLFSFVPAPQSLTPYPSHSTPFWSSLLPTQHSSFLRQNSSSHRPSLSSQSSVLAWQTPTPGLSFRHCRSSSLPSRSSPAFSHIPGTIGSTGATHTSTRLLYLASHSSSLHWCCSSTRLWRGRCTETWRRSRTPSSAGLSRRRQ